MRKLLRLLVGRRKRVTLSEDLATSVSQPLSSGAQEETGGIAKPALPPESARHATLSPSSDRLASLNKFRLSTAASRERLMPQVDELVVFNRPMPLNQLSVAGVSR